MVPLGEPNDIIFTHSHSYLYNLSTDTNNSAPLIPIVTYEIYMHTCIYLISPLWQVSACSRLGIPDSLSGDLGIPDSLSGDMGDV